MDMLLSKLRAGREIPGEGLQLSFRITGELPEDKDGGSCRFFVAGRRGDGSAVYTASRSLSGAEEAEVEGAKSAVVEALRLSGGKTIAEAYNAAMELLSKGGKPGVEFLAYVTAHDTAGFGPFSMLMEDKENIEEIIINRPCSPIIVYHSRLGFCRTNLAFRSEQAMRSALNRLVADAERELSSQTPIIDAQLADGSRVHAQSRPYSTNGAAVSIRLRSRGRVGVGQLLEGGTFTGDTLAYLWMAVDCGMNIVVSGAPASGKTSLLLSLLSLLPRYERIVVVEEDASELSMGDNFANSVNLQGRTHLLSKAGLRDQVMNALHVRPDRIVIGELRGAEARDVFSAGNLGMPFMTTMHSNCDGASLLGRLSSKPMEVEPQALSALDLAVFMRKDGTSRRIDSICEYSWAVRDNIDIKACDQDGCVKSRLDIGALKAGAQGSKVLARFSRLRMVSMQKAVAELRKRSKYVSAMPAGADAASYVQAYGL